MPWCRTRWSSRRLPESKPTSCLQPTTPVSTGVVAFRRKGVDMRACQHRRVSARPSTCGDTVTRPGLEALPLCPALPLPDGFDEEQLRSWLCQVRVEKASAAELEAYCRDDFRRFVYTWGMCRDLSGRCLEIGSDPYFTSFLLRHFTALELTHMNYFGPHVAAKAQERVCHRCLEDGSEQVAVIDFDHFNTETDPFPYPDDRFDVILFCEVVEHLTHDPVRVMNEIRRVLRPDGTLILTTPNVARLENVARFIAGANIYDPYSGYGPYGRHNREYNRHELSLLLRYTGFTVVEMFTADVHDNHAGSFVDLADLVAQVSFRAQDLGQYIFVRAINDAPPHSARPTFLYRSLPHEQLEPFG